MRIKSMTATFGKLERARLEPGPGLTLIHAPNEGGKSTWAAFWRTMLYGIDTRDRDKKGYLADKNRYQPWSGAPMEGGITLDLDGRDITIRRGPRGNVPFGSFSAVFTGTQEPVPGLTASNCGELLTGVGAEVFTRSAFLGSGSLSLTTAPELERRIAALVTAGEEDVSFSQAMERLKEWKNRRQVNKSVGEIPKLEAELAQTREALASLEEASARIAGLEAERTGLERERDALERQVRIHRAIAQKQQSDRRAQAEGEYQAARRQLDSLEQERSAHPLPGREELKQAQGELQYLKVLEEEIKQGGEALAGAEEQTAAARQAAKDDHFPGLSGEEAVAKAAAHCAEYQAIVQKAGTPGKYVKLFLGMSVGFVIGWLLSYTLLKGTLSPFFLAGAIPGCAVTALILGLLARKKRKTAREILERYSVQTPEELTALARDYQERCRSAGELARQAEALRTAVADRQNRRDATKAQLLDFVHQFAPEVTDLFGCSAALSRALNLDHDLALARERTSALRRLVDDLPVQEETAGEDPSGLPLPPQSLEETLQALTRTAGQLEQTSAQLNQARGVLQAMGDPAALSARAEGLEERLARLRLEHEALSAAMDALTQANARLQERFSPELNRWAGQYMARLTGEKYSAVSLTRELEGFVPAEGGVLPRSALYLSRGTADQLYLAVRLAVCRLCLPERPPILLDDALASFDDSRLALALDLLLELAREQQILLFTCQRREGELLDREPGVTRIAL